MDARRAIDGHVGNAKPPQRTATRLCSCLRASFLGPYFFSQVVVLWCAINHTCVYTRRERAKLNTHTHTYLMCVYVCICVCINHDPCMYIRDRSGPVPCGIDPIKCSSAHICGVAISGGGGARGLACAWRAVAWAGAAAAAAPPGMGASGWGAGASKQIRARPLSAGP